MGGDEVGWLDKAVVGVKMRKQAYGSYLMKLEERTGNGYDCVIADMIGVIEIISLNSLLVPNIPLAAI